MLQQVEHFGDPTTTVNDAFRPVSRYFDRITRPEQLLASLPQVARVLTDPADAGPVMLALPQDVQAEEWDFPEAFFEPRVHRVPRPRADRDALARRRGHHPRSAERPLLVLGGGVRYSGAAAEALAFAEAHGVPVVETVAGRTLVPHDHPLYGGPLGIVGSASANALAAEADVVLAVGTRLQDFTTSSWTGFSGDVRGRHGQRRPLRRGQARRRRRWSATRARCWSSSTTALAGWVAPSAWADRAARGEGATGTPRSTGCAPAARPPTASLTYAQVDRRRQRRQSGPDDYVLTASGGMPGELHGGWRTGKVTPGATSGATMDLEYGFSCMGYEIVAPWGAAMARARTHPDGVVTSIFGDGSYLMLNSELYSAAFAGHAVRRGALRQRRLRGDPPAADRPGRRRVQQPARRLPRPRRRRPGSRVDFAAHARSLGCHVEDGRGRAHHEQSFAALRTAYAAARAAAVAEQRPAVVVCRGGAVGLDRVGRLVGDRHARVAVRPRGVRRGQGAPGPLALTGSGG